MLKYHEAHCWIRIEAGEGVVGLSAFALDNLNEVIYIDLPVVGSSISQGEPFGEVESTKTTAELIAPVSGLIKEVNEGLEDDPGPINESPLGDGWICRVELSDPDQVEGLLDEAAYLALAEAAEEEEE